MLGKRKLVCAACKPLNPISLERSKNIVVAWDEVVVSQPLLYQPSLPFLGVFTVNTEPHAFKVQLGLTSRILLEATERIPQVALHIHATARSTHYCEL